MGDELKCLKEGVCTFLGVQAYFQVIVVLKRCWNHFGLWIGSRGLIPSSDSRRNTSAGDTQVAIYPFRNHPLTHWFTWALDQFFWLPSFVPKHSHAKCLQYKCLQYAHNIWEVGGFGMRLSYTTHHNNVTSPSHLSCIIVYGYNTTMHAHAWVSHKVDNHENSEDALNQDSCLYKNTQSSSSHWLYTVVIPVMSAVMKIARQV